MNQYFLDLFSGIGGFALGAYWAGCRFDSHYFSEVDEYAIKIYKQRFPDAIGLGDIRNIRGADLPAGEWIIAGGFPCQDISVAGKGAGLAGARSGLWYEYARIIGELRPRFAIMENVGALTHRGLDAVLGSLAEIGYDAEWQDIRASDVGAPHRRERIWIVAYLDGVRRGQRGLATGPYPDAEQGCLVAHPRGSGLAERMREPGDAGAEQPTAQRGGQDVADAARELPHGSRGAWGRRTEPADGGETLAHASNGGDVWRDGELGATQGEVRGPGRSPSHGCREWWAVEPDVGRVAYGVPARVDRLKCLGNSIVPQIAELIFQRLAQCPEKE